MCSPYFYNGLVVVVVVVVVVFLFKSSPYITVYVFADKIRKDMVGITIRF